MVNRKMLERSLLKAGATAEVVLAVIELHSTAQYLVSSGGQSGIPTTRGIRQGCRLAPALWSILSAQLLQDLREMLQLQNLDNYTAFADDTLGHWVIHSPDDIRTFTTQAIALLRTLQQYGLKLNEETCLQGPEAAKALKGKIVLHQQRKCWHLQDHAILH